MRRRGRLCCGIRGTYSHEDGVHWKNRLRLAFARPQAAFFLQPKRSTTQPRSTGQGSIPARASSNPARSKARQDSSMLPPERNKSAMPFAKTIQPKPCPRRTAERQGRHRGNTFYALVNSKKFVWLQIFDANKTGWRTDASVRVSRRLTQPDTLEQMNAM